MTSINYKIFLYAGLALLAVALITKAVWVDSKAWLPVFCVAILLKIVFLILSFQKNKWQMTLWLKLILVGVVLIFISMFFKYVFPVVLLADILFYGAITLKVTGLLLMIFGKLSGSSR